VALIQLLPVLCRLGCQQMEKSVVSRRNGSSETSLTGLRPFTIGEMVCLFEELIWERHPIIPDRLVPGGVLELFGF
jgi:hypothetical protein